MDRHIGPTRKQECLRHSGVEEGCCLRFAGDATRSPHQVVVGIECDVRCAEELEDTMRVSTEQTEGQSISSAASIVAAVLWLAVFIGGAGVAYGQQDVVITTNGDKLVGEIKRVEKDVLTIETPYSDADFKIEWEDVVSIESDRQFLVETFEGQRLTGSLKSDPDKKLVLLVGSTTSVLLAEVATVQPFERTFWSRIDTALDFGYSLTKTNSARSSSLLERTSRPGTRATSMSSSPMSSGARKTMRPPLSDGTWQIRPSPPRKPAGTRIPPWTS